MSGERVSEMVDRVARAISGAPFPSAASYRKARAAIEAMAEPTDAMMIAAADSFGKRRMHVGHSGSDQVAGAITAYRAMIAAALSPTQEP